MNIEERLNNIIEEKESRIEQLEQDIEQMKNEADLSRMSWQMHKAFQNDDFYKQIPYPRMEMRLERLGNDPGNWYSIQWVYGLVYKHVVDTTNDTLLFIPFGCTTSNGGRGTFESRYVNQELETPFRDSLHIRVEAHLLSLPAYIVCREKGIFNQLDISDHAIGIAAKTRS